MSETKPMQLMEWVAGPVRQAVEPLLPVGQWSPWEASLRAAVMKDSALLAAVKGDLHGTMIALTHCAEVGLSPNPVHKHFALVPRKGRICGEIQYHGWRHLVMTKGDAEWVHADVIYRQERTGNPLVDPVTRRVDHVPNELERDDYGEKDIVAAYCMVKRRGQDRLVTKVLTRKNIEKRMALSGKGNGSGSPVWRAWFVEMCLAKAIRATCGGGEIPLEERAGRAIAAMDDEQVRTVGAVVVDPLPLAPLPDEEPEAPAPAGGDQFFEETNADPFPEEGAVRERQIRAIEAEFRRRKLTKAVVASAIEGVCGDAAARLDQLTDEELEQLWRKFVERGDA